MEVGNFGKPYLEILVQPQPKFRFRYKSEMTGKHGSLLGVYPSLRGGKMEFPEATTTGGSSPSAPSTPVAADKNINLLLHKSDGMTAPGGLSSTTTTRMTRPQGAVGGLADEHVRDAQPGPAGPSSHVHELRETMGRGSNNGLNHLNLHHDQGAGRDFSGSNDFLTDDNVSLEVNVSDSFNNVATNSAFNNYNVNGPKIYPTVKLNNFASNAIIRCSLVNESAPHYPHVHALGVGQLVGKEPAENLEDASSTVDYVEIPVSQECNHTAVFQGLNIIYTGKKGMRKILTEKLEQLEEGDVRKVGVDQIDTWSLNSNLNVVCLYFEAYLPSNEEEDNRGHTIRPQVIHSSKSSSSSRHPHPQPNRRLPICAPVVSHPIQHNKSTQTGDLRIVRIDKHASYCTGDEEVFILVEKVDKHNIQVKFFQNSGQGVEIWKAYGKFSKLDVHHQYAIVFKTPPYRSCDIDCEVDVWLQLERPSDGATSQPIPFKYKPIERLRKMPKRQVHRRSSGYDDDSSRGGSSAGHSSPGGKTKFSGKDPKSAAHEYQTQPGNADPNQDPSSNSESARQGTASTIQKFPCDYGKFATEAAKAASTKVAFNVALSVGEGLHSWAETSDFDFLLHKLRHLLCLVDDNGNNALHAAISNKQHEPFMKILNIMTSSPDISNAINEQNIQNQTPIALAVCTDCPDFVLELAKRDADLAIPDNDGDTPIHLAVKSNNLNCLRALLHSRKIESTLNRFNYASLTPLHLTVTHGHLEALDMICRVGVNLNVQEGTFGRTPLHLAVEKGSITATMIILQAARESELLEIVNAQNYRGDTSLHVAASSGLVAISAILLYYGADRTIENFIAKENMDAEEIRIGQTPIDVSANKEVVKTLQGTIEEWEKVVKTCSQLLDTRPNKDQKTFSLDNLHIDSGIDMKDHSVYSK